MARIGVYEAKTHLPRLLDRVALGESITITRHGQPVAVLSPIGRGAGPSVPDAIAGLRAFRQGRTLGGATLRELIEEGRRA